MIYFDNAASTPVDKRVLKAMEPYWQESFANSSSIHFLGKKVHKAVEDAREIVARFLGSKSDEIIFTSGATESNNIAIKGIIKGILFEKEQACICCKPQKPHIISLKIEHHSVSKPIEEMQKMGMAEITLFSVEPDGILDIGKFKEAIKNNTRLVSVMYANNEIGTIQPVKEIAEILKEENKKRDENSRIYFHTDASQGYSLDCNTDNLGVDALSFSAHKFYGPKGIGVLFLRENTPFIPIINGGKHEGGKRAGTQNVPAIAGLAKAIELINPVETDKTRELRDSLLYRIKEEISGFQVNGSMENRIGGNLNISFDGLEGESLMLKLSDAGIAVSTGSACAIGEPGVSYVLDDLGLTPRQAHSSIRISLGRQNTRKEIIKFVKVLKREVGELRRIAGK